MVVIYSLSYIRHYPYQNEYYFMVVLFLGAMMGLVFSANLLLLYVFWEITAIASWRLIGFFREESYVRRADKAFLITMFGAVSMLVGFIIVYSQTGSFDLATISNKLNGSPLPDLAVGLIMLGILSKSATLPLHTWLPDAGVAPSPVTGAAACGCPREDRRVRLRPPVCRIVRFLPVLAFDAAGDRRGKCPWFRLGRPWSTLTLSGSSRTARSARLRSYSWGLASGSIVGVAGAVLYILMHGLPRAACSCVPASSSTTRTPRTSRGWAA